MAGESRWTTGLNVTEMGKQLPQEKIYKITRCFQDLCTGLEEAPSSWKIVKSVLLRQPDAEPQSGIRGDKGHRHDVSDVEVVCNLHSTIGTRMRI